MSENNSNENNDLLNALNSIDTVNVGDVVKGEVLAVDDDKQVIVGIEGTGLKVLFRKKNLPQSQLMTLKMLSKSVTSLT